VTFSGATQDAYVAWLERLVESTGVSLSSEGFDASLDQVGFAFACDDQPASAYPLASAYPPGENKNLRSYARNTVMIRSEFLLAHAKKGAMPHPMFDLPDLPLDLPAPIQDAFAQTYGGRLGEDALLERRWRPLVGKTASWQFDHVVATTALPSGEVEQHVTFFGVLLGIKNGMLAFDSREPGSPRKTTVRTLHVPVAYLIGALVVPEAHHGLSVVSSEPSPLPVPPSTQG